MDMNLMNPSTGTQSTSAAREHEGASEHGNHLNGVCELRDSEWTIDKENTTIGYMAYPDHTSNLSLHPPTHNDELNKFNHLTVNPNPTPPTIYEDLSILQHD